MSVSRGSESGATVVLDSHIHFWDTRLLDYPWLRSVPELERPFLPEDLDVGEIEVEAMVFVQANPVWDQVEEETAWVRGLGGQDRRIQGLVAGVPLERGAAGVAPWLEQLAATPGVAGVRQLIQGEPAGFALTSEFVEAVRLAGSHGLAVDLCVQHEQLPEITELVRRCPAVTFVLDHLGKPDIRGGSAAVWAGEVSQLAGLDNVVCKLSGLTSEAPGMRTWDIFTDYLRTAIEVFGPGRCMFGSDWPNAGRDISYPGWVALVAAAASDLDHVEQTQVMAETARDVYARAWAQGLVGAPEAYD
jgi:L-fuconolactonase